MSRAPKYPLRWDTYSSCSTCGSWIPSRYVIQTRKHGFQCLPGNGITRGCWDGNFDRDDIYYVYPANEGTRETTSPLTNFATEGLDANDLAYNQFLLRDQSTGTVYLVTIGPDTVTLTAETDPERFGTIIWRCVSISTAQELTLIIVNGALAVIGVVCENVSSATQLLTAVPPGGLVLNPPDGTPIVIIPPTPPPTPVPPVPPPVSVDGPPLPGSCVPTFSAQSGGVDSCWDFVNAELFDTGGGVYAIRPTSPGGTVSATLDLACAGLCGLDSTSPITFGIDKGGDVGVFEAIVTGLNSPLGTLDYCGVSYGPTGAGFRAFNLVNPGEPLTLQVILYSFGGSPTPYIYKPYFSFGTQTAYGDVSGTFAPCDDTKNKLYVYGIA
jgi:hypothetical protein